MGLSLSNLGVCRGLLAGWLRDDVFSLSRVTFTTMLCLVDLLTLMYALFASPSLLFTLPAFAISITECVRNI